ncbi:hypothetical protein [Synechococcus sp. PCC 7336]|uniref:hypothetical protein n=1 Tax=Synechococcus sp. PCC 7336 TaxID=195250 RepID=UPI000347302F|nr:hypothetical protein [Synechococcus sp. PCC 7336]
MAASIDYSYESAFKASQRANWQVEDLIGNGKQLDFSKSFLPDALAGVGAIASLGDREKRILNQIRGNSYLYLFGVVEEFILPFVLQHIQNAGYHNIFATQALLHFAEEESKHIRLFRCFAEEFARGFGSECECIGPPEEIAAAVLQHSPLGVALATLHIEWMTQRHYIESIRGNRTEDLDAQFCNLLRHHWLEEAQHTQLDTLVLQELVAELEPDAIARGIDDYFAICQLLDGGLMAQVELDIASFSLATGLASTELEKQAIRATQQVSYRWTFLGSGMTHPNFLQTLGELSKPAVDRVRHLASLLV